MIDIDTLPAKNMEYIFISTIVGIFVGCAGCFCTWKTFLRTDIAFGQLICT